MVYTEHAITTLYEESLAEAEAKLASLDIAEGRSPSARGLSGWVFEQTIRFCLAQELRALGLTPDIREQVPLVGRARADMGVGKAAIELKVRGSFGAGDSKYSDYRAAAEHRGLAYLYLTMQETYAPYRDATRATFGADKSFFLDAAGDWARFVDAVAGLVA
jgi:hypothetical protein